MTERETVSYDFQANGVRDVVQAFQTVEQVMLRAEKASVESARREALRRLEVTREGGRRRASEEKKTFEQISQQEANLLSKSVATANARDEIAKRSAQKRKDTELALYKDLERMASDHARKVAQIEEEAHRKTIERRRQYAQLVSGAATGAVRSMASTAASWGGMALSIGGGVTVASAAQKAMSSEASSISLANSMFNPNDDDQKAWFAGDGKSSKFAKNGRFDKQALMGLAGQISASSGLDKATLASGIQSYVAKSSDWKTVVDPGDQQTLFDLAKLAYATDTQFSDVMQTAGSLKVQNKGLKSKEMMEMMYSIVGQGKAGSIEMNEVAKYGSTITNSSGKYAGDQGAAQRKLLGLVQVSARAAASGADAATGVARFGGDVAKKAKENEAKYGMKVMDANGQLYAPSQILSEYFRVTKGNTTKMGEGHGNLGLGMESIKVAMGVAGTYQAEVANARAGKGNADILKKLGLSGKKKLTEDDIARIGAEAVRRDVAQLENAGYDKKTINRDAAEKAAGLQERFDKVTRELSAKLETRVVPFLEKLAVALEKNSPQIDRFMSALDKVANFILENPWSSLGIAVTAKITGSIAEAMIGDAVKNTLTSALEKSMGVSAGNAAGGAGAQGGAGALAYVALPALSVAALYADVVDIKNWKESGQKDGATAAALMQSGDPAQQAQAVGILKGQRELGSTPMVLGAYLAQATQMLSDFTTGGATRAGRYLTDQGVEKVTGKKARDYGLESLRAKDLIDTYDLKMQISRTIADGVRSGVADAKGAADPSHPSRQGPQTSPQRK